MVIMKRTHNKGTVSASTYKVGNAIGIIVGIYNNADVVCLEEIDNKLRLLINDEAIENLEIEVVHTDSKWGE